MNIKLKCPVCGYQEIEGKSCPNCDTDLSLIRMLQELPQTQTTVPKLKVTAWQLGIALLILIIGMSLGSFGSLLLLQPQLNTLTVSSPNPVAVSKASPKPAVNNPITPKQPPKPTTYIVKKGDHLSGIAEKFCGKGSSWQVMVKTNPQLKGREDYIDIGEVLKIPTCKEKV